MFLAAFLILPNLPTPPRCALMVLSYITNSKVGCKLKGLLITGGCGFIGSNLVRMALADGYRVVNIDALTYAGNRSSLADLEGHPRYTFIKGDIKNAPLLRDALEGHSPDSVMHLAAESHVDRSISAPEDFILTNVLGTFRLLEASRRYFLSLNDEGGSAFRFLHVSTDEVFGSLGPEGRFDEETPYDPRSPYSASKASSDHLVRAYFHTYGLPAVITNCSNNYGPRQFPEKLIPHMILTALAGKSLPLYGDGGNVRDWLHVDDHCRALLTALERGVPGETYVIGGDSERTNLAIVEEICAILDRKRPRPDGKPYREQITFVEDRPGHDRRYAIDAAKIGRELGWKPVETFEHGLDSTVQWYLDNKAWTDSILSGDYRLERLGL